MNIPTLSIQVTQSLAPDTPIQEVRAAEPLSVTTQTAASAPAAPVYDKYTPGSPAEATGLYRVAHDENGMPRIEYDNPDVPDRATPESKAETTTTNTDRVDGEIRRLKEKQKDLKRQIASAGPQAAQALERQLAQVENKLRQKNNDVYRRQNAVIS